jgi:RND family efflux transporter MFP subunit
LAGYFLLINPESASKMKLNIKFYMTALAVTALASCGQNNNISDEHDEHHHEEGEHNHSGEIVVEPEIAERFGLKVDTIAAGAFNQAIRVSGEILPSNDNMAIVTAPNAGIVKFASNITVGSIIGKGGLIASIDTKSVTGGDANQSARAALDAAKRELDRLRPLYEEHLVNASTYNAAVTAYEQAKSAYSSSASSCRATAPIAGIVTEVNIANGEYAQAGSAIATIVSDTRLTIRADVPERYRTQLAAITDARIKTMQDDEIITVSELGGKRISGASVAGAAAGYIPVWFEVKNDGRLSAGSAVEIYLLGNTESNVISLPVSALTEQQGVYFVYEKIDEEGYRKIPVTIGESDGKRVVIKSGLKGGEAIVTEGAMTVRLAESSGVAIEGHNHNH